jgi:hypothetical protein
MSRSPFIGIDDTGTAGRVSVYPHQPGLTPPHRVVAVIRFGDTKAVVTRLYLPVKQRRDQQAASRWALRGGYIILYL